MPPHKSTPTPAFRPLLSADPSTWRNAAVGAYVVQAVPHTQSRLGLALLTEGCPSERDGPCPGVSMYASRGVRLDRDEALHAISEHYHHANWSICRFVDHGSPEYAADLIFEVDAHVHGAPLLVGDHHFYTPPVGIAVLVGRRILDHLTAALGVDSRYITTCVTRMGARVTVDWRAFGPRRLHQLLAVVRYIESQAFEEGELDRLAERLRRAMVIQARRQGRQLEQMLDVPIEYANVRASVAIDGAIYRASEVAVRSRSKAREYKGPMIRPPGTLHSASSHANMWIRVTPIPHDRFRPGFAAWLSRVSRSRRGHRVSEFPEPRLFAHPWPESRWRAADAEIEGARSAPRLEPATKLMDLLDGWDQLALRPQHREEVQAQAGRTMARRSGPSVANVTPEVVEAVVHAVAVGRVRARENCYQFPCPYCTGRGSKNTGALFHETGVFHCFSDNCEAREGLSLYAFASSFGFGHLIPFKPASSMLVKRALIRDLPAREIPLWSDLASVEREAFSDVSQARTWMAGRLEQLLTVDKSWTALVVAGPTGIGKTTTVLNVIRRLGIVIRGSAPRDESRQPFVELLRARAILGRRTGEGGNCRNEDIDVLAGRGLPARLACNSRCSSYRGCAYLAQFEGIEGVSLALNHAHLGLLEMKKLDNGSDVVVIDENPMMAAVENTDLDQVELDLMRVGVELSSPAWTNEPIEDVGLDEDVRVRPAGATPRIEALLSWLISMLTLDRMGEFEGDIAADLPLARCFVRDGRLATLLAGIEEADLDAHDAAVLSVAETYLADRRRRRPPKSALRELVDGLRELLWRAVANSGGPARIYATRGDRGWGLRISRRRDLLHGKTIILSSTLTPVQFVAAFGECPGLRVLEPRLEHRERRTLVADHQFGTRTLLGKKPNEVATREKLFTTARALVSRERDRTGLPVVVGGRAAVLNLFVEAIIGRRLPAQLRMPHSGQRNDRMAELRAITEPHGFLVAYAGGVSGSNEFCVLDRGIRRFCRSFILLGNIIPPLGEIEGELRGMLVDFPFSERIDTEFGPFARQVERAVDWRAGPRTVRIPGTELGEGDAATIKVAQNSMGFVDPFAADLLHHLYEGEAAQMIGRIRGSIPDPVDPTIHAQVWILAHLVIPDFEIDQTLNLSELRESLGLEGDAAGVRGPRRSNQPEVIAKRVKKSGRVPTLQWMARGIAQSIGYHPYGRQRGTVMEVEALWREAGLEWRDSDHWATVEAATEALEARAVRNK